MISILCGFLYYRHCALLLYVPFYLLTEIENFLSDEECDHLISEALKKGLYNSHTLEGLDDINRQRFELLDENKDHQMSIDEVSTGIATLIP